MAFSTSIVFFIIATMATLVSSITNPFGFVRDGTCESHGMHSIRDAVQCKAAALAISEAEGLRTDTTFICRQQNSGPSRPTGCSYHQFGNIELWGATTGDCDVNGFGGCFCIKDSYGFVRTGTCESNGMHSIHNGVQCQKAADTISEAEGLRTDTTFIDRTHVSGPSRPTGCSYHQFGNIEQWGATTGDCDVNGFGGCFCIEGKCGSVGGGSGAGDVMYLLDFMRNNVLIMALLIVNIFLFVYICCYGKFKKNKSKPKYETVAVYSTEEEDKPINNL